VRLLRHNEKVVGDSQHRLGQFSGMSLDRVPLAPPSRKRARGPLLV
jgi:hypothetical protein